MPRAERAHMSSRAQEPHAPVELPGTVTQGAAPTSRLLSRGRLPGMVPDITLDESGSSPGRPEHLVPNHSDQVLFGHGDQALGTQLSPHLLRAGMNQEAPESGSGLLVVSQPQEPREQTLFTGSTTVPQDVLPAGHHVVIDSATGLAVVSKVKRQIISDVSPEDLPDQERTRGIDLPTKKEHVPLATWLASPDAALWALAQQTSTNALDLVEAAKTEKEMRHQAISHDADHETTIRALGELASHTARRLQKQDFTRHERIALAVENSAYPSDMSQARLKLILPETLAEEFPKEDYTEKQIEEKHTAMDSFFTAVLEDTQEVIGTSQEQRVMERLTHLADLHRLQTKTIQIPGNKTAEKLTELITSKDIITPPMVELLTRFEIPPSLGGEILSRMDQARLLNHPLALHLMDQLPKDHPFKREQQKRVDRLTTLLSDDISSQEFFEAVQLRDRIVSVYVDPDSDPKRDKVGLEFENFPLITGITVPYGTTMGQDADDPQSIPELRLDNETDVLMYGTQWRERYFNLLQWTQLTQTEQRSLHLHINRTEDTRPELYKLVFGFDYDLVKENILGTMEVRSTLKDYKRSELKQEGIVGFSSVYMPELVDLMYSLRNVTFTPVDLSDMQQDRFDFFAKAVSDPLSRAALLIALRGEAGHRVLNPAKEYDYIAEDTFSGGAFKIDGQFNAFTLPSQKKILTSVLDKNDPHYNQYVAGRIHKIDESLHRAVVTKLLASGDPDVILELTSNISALNDMRLQNQVANKVMALRDTADISQLAEHIDMLQDPAMQTKVAKYILNHDMLSPLVKLIENAGSLEPQTQRDIITDTLQRKKNNMLVRLGETLHTLDPEVLEDFVTETFKKKDRQRIAILGAHIGSLDSSYQKRFITFLEEERSAEGIFMLANTVDKIDKSLQVKAAKLTLGFQNGVAIDGLIRHIGIFDETMQEKIVTTAHTYVRRGSLALLGEKIGNVDPSLHEKIIDKIIDTKNHGIQILAGSLDVINRTLHQKIVTATFATNDFVTIRALLSHIDAADITIQKRYIDWALTTGDQELLYIGKAIGLFEATQQDRVITYADDNFVIPFFEVAAQEIALVDPALHNKIATNVVLDGNEEALFALGDNFSLLSPAARATVTPYLERYHSELYRAASMNVPGWKYPNAA